MRNSLLKVFLLGLLSASTLAEARLPPIKPGIPGKKKGDIIAPMLDEQIAAWCDFNKQIIVTRTNILCAYIGDKQEATVAQIAHEAPKKLVHAKRIPKDLKPTPYEMTEYGDA